MLVNSKLLKNKVKRVLSNQEGIDIFLRKVYISAFRCSYWLRFKGSKVKNNSFIFECFSGKKVNDSPLAIFNYLVSSNFQGKYTWVLSSNEHPMYKELSSINNTTVVLKGTHEYYLAYAKAHFWVVNCRIPLRVVKKENQKFVQCWHGTPLKMMGHDIKVGDNAKVSQSGLRYSYSLEASQINYFISPSDYASKCFISSFGLDKSQILQLGYPRNDSIFIGGSNIDLIKALKISLDIPVNKTVILYAPTWRDNLYCPKKQRHILDNPLENIDFLNKFSDDYVFLYRGHYFTELESESSKFIDVSSYDNVNDLYLIADLLITDYSSVFFDFSILNKPTLFYMYDRLEYESKLRGFYFDIDKGLPGEICTSLSSLADNVLSSLNKKHDLSHFNAIYNPYEDGLSAKRVVNAIINGSNESL